LDSPPFSLLSEKSNTFLFFFAFCASLWHQDGFNALLCAGLGLLVRAVYGRAGQGSATTVIAPVSKRRQVAGQGPPKRKYIRKAQRVQMRWERIFTAAVGSGMAGQEAMLRQQLQRLREQLRQRETYFEKELSRITEYKGTVKEVRDNTWSEVSLYLDQSWKELQIANADNARLRKDMEILLDKVSAVLVEKVGSDGSPPKRASDSSPGGCCDV